jgi:hypothetical protein
MMKILIRAVISGFGFSLGAALFRKLSKHLGLDDDKKDEPETVTPPPPAQPPDGDLAQA